MTLRHVPLALALLVLSACATHPKPLQGGFADITPHAAAATDSTGAMVRWGGRIVQVEPREDRTCFEMISTRLTSTGRPYWADDDTNGRFIACRAGFYDPAVFEKNREVTFTGRIEGYETRRIGEYDYRFPRIAADVVYLWPRREDEYRYHHHHHYHRPFPPSPWPWWGWWW